jgi:ferritin-like metal-binding protein YciE
MLAHVHLRSNSPGGRQMPEQLKGLDELFIRKLQRLYDAEQRLAEALPKLRNAAKSPDLRDAFGTHLTETETHVERIQQIFGLWDQAPKRYTDEAIESLIDVGSEVIDLDADGPVKDAALIGAAQEAEHYEIAAYGTLRAWAQTLGKPEATQLLSWTLEEEKKTDQKLTQIAGDLNFQAVAPPVLSS